MSILEKFNRYDADNPHVWEYFVRFSLDAIRAGRRRLSTSLIVERIRWELSIETVSSDSFKVSNNFKPYYARKFHAAFPQYQGYFKTNRLKGVEA